MRLIATRRYDFDGFWDTQKLYRVGTSYALHHKSTDPDEAESWMVHNVEQAREWSRESPEPLEVRESMDCIFIGTDAPQPASQVDEVQVTIYADGTATIKLDIETTSVLAVTIARFVYEARRLERKATRPNLPLSP